MIFFDYFFLIQKGNAEGGEKFFESVNYFYKNKKL